MSAGFGTAPRRNRPAPIIHAAQGATSAADTLKDESGRVVGNREQEQKRHGWMRWTKHETLAFEMSLRRRRTGPAPLSG